MMLDSDSVQNQTQIAAANSVAEKFGALELLMEPVCCTGEDGRILSCNTDFAQLVGSTVGETIGTTLFSHFGVEIESALRSWLTQARAYLFRETAILEGNGEVRRSVLLIGNSISVGNGVLLCFIALRSELSNETVRDEAPRFWHLRDDRATILEATKIGLFGYEARDVGYWFTDEALRIWGIEPTGSFENFAPPHSEDRILVGLMDGANLTLDRDSRFFVEHRFRYPDGTSKWLTTLGRTQFELRDGKLQATRSIGLTVDVTKRRETQWQLEESLRLAADAADLGIITIDYSTDTCVLDTKAATMFELSPGVVTPRSTVHERFHPDDREQLTRLVAEVLNTSSNGAFAVQHRILLPSGSTRWLSVRKTVNFESKDGIRRPSNGLLVAFDITALRAAEEQLRQSMKNKDEFLAILAHELRNPLASIRAGMEVLKLEKDTVASQSTRLTVERQVEQMSRLVDDLLDLSRIERGKMSLKISRFPIAEAIQSAVDECLPHIESKSQSLNIHQPGTPLSVEGDLTRLTQVIANLLDNAAKYTSNGGQILLSVERRADKVVIAIQDNGIGISAEDIDRVFEPFAQVGDAAERNEGLGVGLSLAKQLIDLHRGELTVNSEGLGFGSCFTVQLPLASNQARQAIGNSVTHTATSKTYRIMVVDDNNAVADVIVKLLKLMGHDAVVARGGFEALRVAEVHQPEIVLLDINMPGLNGYETCRRLRELDGGSEMYVVAQTGAVSGNSISGQVETGFDAVLIKPISPDALRKLIAEFRP